MGNTHLLFIVTIFNLLTARHSPRIAIMWLKLEGTCTYLGKSTYTVVLKNFRHAVMSKFKHLKYFLQQMIKATKTVWIKFTRSWSISSTCTTVRVSHHVDPDFKPKDGLPNPNGPLSLSIPSQTIALANSEVMKATRDKSILPDKCASLEYSRAFQTPPWWAASRSLWAFAFYPAL